MEDAQCLDESNILDGINCMKNLRHAGTHAYWEEVDGVYTLVTWSVKPV